jgi:hypothetical protein
MSADINPVVRQSLNILVFLGSRLAIDNYFRLLTAFLTLESVHLAI